MFSLLEEAGQHSTLAHLTRLVPWSRARRTENEIETEGWAIHVRHLCAKYAARICLSANDRGRFFEIVAEVSTWEFESGEHAMQFRRLLINKVLLSCAPDDESIPELAAEAEKIAVELHNEERDLDACLRWYDVIIKFVNHRGSSHQLGVLFIRVIISGFSRNSFVCLILISRFFHSLARNKTKKYRDRLDGRVECDGLRLGHGPSVRQPESTRARPAHPSIRRLVRSVSTQRPTQTISLRAETRRYRKGSIRYGYSDFTIQMFSHSPDCHFDELQGKTAVK